MWWKIVLLIIAILAAAVLVTWAYGSSRWRAETRELAESLRAKQVPPSVKVYDPEELEDLPAPVQRYFRKVLKAGQNMIAAVHIKQEGTFNNKLGSDAWSPFTATVDVVTQRPGFVWDARISMMGIPVHVHDAYVGGEGILRGRLLGALPVMEMRGTPEAAEGELYRYLAEAPCYPTALLPSQGVRWEAVDNSSARVTLEDGGTRVTMLFTFGEDDLIESVYAEARGREVSGKIVPTPWKGTWSQYESHGGMLVPTSGEIAWILQEGLSPYWRGRIVEYNFEWAE